MPHFIPLHTLHWFGVVFLYLAVEHLATNRTYSAEQARA
jgi:hypothetical protein